MKKILLVGGSGLVGSNCHVYFKHFTNYAVTATHYSYPTNSTVHFDPLIQSQIEKYSLTNWDCIIHTGALTHVDRCESNSDLSFALTVESTKKLVELAKMNNSFFVYISTDYVFDGKNGPYTENDPVNPLSVYGKHKLEAENIVRDEIQNSLILRITNVYGSEDRNKNFVARVIGTLNTNGGIDISVPRDQFATPINAFDIAKCIYELLANNKTGIYHLASTDYMSRAQLINRIKDYFPGYRFNINYVSTKELNQIASRPLYGGLIAAKFLNEFPAFQFSNLDDYLRKYNESVQS